MLTLESPAPQDETLPNGWTKTTLGELGTVHSGGTPRTGDATNFEGGIPWITPADLSGYTAKFIAEGRRSISERGLASSGATLMPAGTVLFSSRAPVGYVVIASESVSTNQGFKSLHLCGGVFNEYVYYYLKASKGLAESFASGTTFLEISGASFGRLPIPLPPLPEQRRIVAKLEELFTRLDAGVQAVRRSQTFLGRYRKAALKAAVDGDLTEVWRAARVADDGRTLGAQQSPISWTKANLGALTTKITSGSRDWSKYYGRGTGTFLMAQNVRPGRLDLTFRQAVDPPIGDRDRARSQVEPGDILVTIVGANTGNVCRVPGELPEHYVCQSVALLRPRDTSSSPYLAIYLNSEGHGQRQFRNYIYGAGRPHLSFDQLKATTVLLPPLEEQAAIVAEVERRLSIIDALEVTLAANLKRAERLRQSILQRAFSGRLVPQDPTDEPASELLHRIRLEKAARYAAGTGRRRGRPRKDADQEAML